MRLSRMDRPARRSLFAGSLPPIALSPFGFGSKGRRDGVGLIDRHAHLALGRPPPARGAASAGNVLIEEVMPDKSSRAAGQVFKPDRPHKSLRILGRRPNTKPLVTGLKAAQASDMPSKSVGGRKLAGGFDSRPPPLLKASLTSRVAPCRARGGRGRGPIRARTTASTTQVFRGSFRPAPDKSSGPPSEDRTSSQSVHPRHRSCTNGVT
jgi:hypothetical protein